MLTTSELEAWYGLTKALFGVTFRVAEGQALALVGANGAGKTTIIRSITGLLKTNGRIEIRGQRIDGLAAHTRTRRHRIAIVHEGRGLFQRMSVLENIMVGLPSKEREGVKEVVDLFPLIADRLHDRVSDLSGGQQQAVALARAMARRPELLLLDEPSLGLAPVVVDQVYGALSAWRELGATVVLVEQSIPRACDFAEKVCVIRNGRAVATLDTSDPDVVRTVTAMAFADQRRAAGDSGGATE